MSNCIKCGNALSKGRCENLACEWAGGTGTAGAIMLTPARDPELEKMLDAHRKDRERIEFIRRAAIAFAAAPYQQWSRGESMWMNRSPEEAKHEAEQLWEAVREL